MRVKWIIGSILIVVFYGGSVLAQTTQEVLTLEESIKIALERNLQLHSAKEEIVGSEFKRREAFTNFLPIWGGQYSYTHYNSPVTLGSSLSNTSRDIFNLSTTVGEPLFTGGLNLANYRLTKLGVDFSKTTVETVQRDIILQVRALYFNILRAIKLRDVAEQTVKQFEAQLEVSKAFFDVGIVAKNDVLQAEVRLANAIQGLVKADNDLAVAKSSFNILLRRDVNLAFDVVDILEYKAFPLPLAESLAEALRRRPEIKAAEITVDQAKEGVKIARSGYFPTITLTGNYGRSSDAVGLQGDITSERWTIQTLATITLWNWGDTAFRVGESKVRVTQAEDSKNQVIDNITLEVKQDYLNMVTAEKNINVAQKSIEQAEENVRVNEERYKYQVATATDLLDAVTLLAQAKTNYFGALADFNIAKAQLERAMGRLYP